MKTHVNYNQTGGVLRANSLNKTENLLLTSYFGIIFTPKSNLNDVGRSNSYFKINFHFRSAVAIVF